ncbi:TPA: hypothetical protein ACTW97_000768 [Klebsiella michiganensis]
MNKIIVDTSNLNTISECLEQLANAELAQVNIETQLALYAGNKDWRKTAESALRTVKHKRRIVTARLAVLRQQEKETNMRLHQLHNDHLVKELKKIVTPSSFERCVRLADQAIESSSGVRCD